jgi:hypothetical protein
VQQQEAHYRQDLPGAEPARAPGAARALQQPDGTGGRVGGQLDERQSRAPSAAATAASSQSRSAGDQRL